VHLPYEAQVDRKLRQALETMFQSIDIVGHFLYIRGSRVSYPGGFEDKKVRE
jgi:hypothetical protein